MISVPVLMIGRSGSRGVPGKNSMCILGRPLITYPIMAARESKETGDIFLSTDDEELKRIASSYNAYIIDRHPSLCTDTALVEDVIVDGHAEMTRRLGTFDIFVLLFCNNATITPGIIDRGIAALVEDEALDSAVSVSPYNEFSPVRAKRIDENGILQSM